MDDHLYRPTMSLMTILVTYHPRFSVGTNYDAAHQDALSEVSRALQQGDVVAARAELNPTNQYDSKVITLQLHWKETIYVYSVPSWLHTVCI